MEQENNNEAQGGGSEAQAPAAKKGSGKKWTILLIVVILIIAAVTIFRFGVPKSVEGLALGELAELNQKLECNITADVNLPNGGVLPEIRHDIKMEGVTLRTEQFLVDPEGNEVVQTSILKEDGFYSSILDGVEVTNNETGEVCDWLRISFPNGELDEETRNNIVGGLNEIPGDQWQCSTANFSNAEFDTPGVVCDFQ